MKLFLRGVWLCTSFIFVSLLFFPAKPIFAQQEKEVSHLDELVVTATRTKEKVKDIPVTVDVITNDEIKDAGVTNVGDLISLYIPSHYHKYTGMLSPVGLRGFRTESHGDDIKGHVLILVDGHRIGTGNMAKIGVDMIERVEVIRGPASALYGSAAMGGVINIITKKGKGKVHNSLKQEYGSFNFLKTTATSGGTLKNAFSYYMAASYEDRDNYYDPDFGEVYNSDYTAKRIGANLSYFLADNHKVRLGGSYVDLTGGYPSWENWATYTAYQKENKNHYDKSHGYLDFEYNGAFLAGDIELKALAYYLWDKNQWFYGVGDPDSSYTKYIDTTIGTDEQFTLNIIPHNKIVFGFTLESLNKDSEAKQGGVPSTPYTPDLTYDTKSVYLQDSIDLLKDRLNFVFGARYDKFDVSTKRPSGAYISFEERSVDFEHLSPKAGISYKLIEDFLRIRANIGTGFKAPSADQLSAMYEYSSYYGTRRILGNPDLDPEESVTYELGMDITRPWLDLGIGFFHTDYKNMIQTASYTVTYLGKTWETWENVGDAEIEGIDITFALHLHRLLPISPRITLYSNLTFNTKYKNKETDEDLLYISDYEVRSGIRSSFKGLNVALYNVLVGPQKIQNFDQYPAQVEEKSEFTFWDLTFRLNFLKNFTLEGGIYNLLDERYEWVRGYIMPERNYRIGITLRF